MSDFSAEWLALRAGADVRARSTALEETLARWMRERAPSMRGDPAVCVDLACGTGANVRRLAPRLPGPQHWRLVDADARLLAEARRACTGLPAASGEAVTFEVRHVDLADVPLGPEVRGAALVTASALLDLVSATWLERLVAAVAGEGAVGLYALDYDGRRDCTPADPFDAAAHEAFDAHQRTTKSFGVALGPDAARRAAEAFASRGYVVQRATSDWRLGPADADLQRELLRGWAHAAIASRPAARAEVLDWLRRRLAHVASGRSELRVGHEDLLVLPPFR